jgi:hypothetical protein
MNRGSGSREDGMKVGWGKRIDLFEELPHVYQGFFASHLSDDWSFPYTVLVPGFEILGHTTAEKLISVFDGEIHVLEKRGDAFPVQCFPLSGIRYVELRSVLLHSHIKISGITSSGESATAVIQFNSVTDHVFTPILNSARRGRSEGMKPSEQPGSDEFDQWSGLNFKFMNYARRSLMGGEKVICALFQPEIRESRVSFPGRLFSRILSPTHAIILTDREWIAIREEAVQGKKDKYGGTWTYIPLNQITACTLDPVNDTLLALSIHLSGEEHFEYLFPTSRRAEVGQLLERLGELSV